MFSQLRRCWGHNGYALGKSARHGFVQSRRYLITAAQPAFLPSRRQWSTSKRISRWRRRPSLSGAPTVHSIRSQSTAATASAEDPQPSEPSEPLPPPTSEPDLAPEKTIPQPQDDPTSPQFVLQKWMLDRGKKKHSALVKRLGKEFARADRIDHTCLLSDRRVRAGIVSLMSRPTGILSFTDCAPARALVADLANRYGLEVWTVSASRWDQGNDLQLHLAKTNPTTVTKIIQNPEIRDVCWSSILADNAKCQEYLDLYNGRATDVITNTPELLKLFTLENAEAMPEFRLDSLADSSDGHLDPYLNLSEDHKYPLRLSLENARYRLYFEYILPNQEDFFFAFAALVLQYCRQIRLALEKDQQPYLSFKGTKLAAPDWLNRAFSILSWGKLKFANSTCATLPSYKPRSTLGISPLNKLWSCSVAAKHRGIIESGALWPDATTAQTICVMRACVQLKSHLKTAYETGAILRENYAELASYWGEVLPDVVPPTLPELPLRNEVQHQAHQSSAFTEVTPYVTDLTVDEITLQHMLTSLRQTRDLDFQASTQWAPAFEEVTAAVAPIDSHGQSLAVSASLLPIRETTGRRSLSTDLPITAYRPQIVEAAANNDITIIKAATGSGKSTQVPQFLFEAFVDDENLNIVCSQPRRVSTVSVAHRVAVERHSSLGEVVGYQVRFDDKSPKKKNGINYMTSGYLLRLLESDPVGFCSRHSHVILDEVHERDVDTDLILTCLKNILRLRPPTIQRIPRIIIMSATLDVNFFRNYFDGDEFITTILVPGRTFPVVPAMLDNIWPSTVTSAKQQHALEQDRDFMSYLNTQLPSLTDSPSGEASEEQTQSHIENEQRESPSPDEEALLTAQPELGTLYVPVPLIVHVINDVLSKEVTGDILVFLPGLGEIEDVERCLLEGEAVHHDFMNTNAYRLFKLHSSLYETNYEAWNPVPEGCRRVILATNIAETSVTLPDVKTVIDTGYSRLSIFDQSAQAGNFGMRWISKAEVAQRKGRAGRTQSGKYIATFSQAQYDKMQATPQPEMLRTSLDSVVLRVQASKAFAQGNFGAAGAQNTPAGILSTTPSPPDPTFVSAAVDQLQSMHALLSDGKPSAMGQFLSRMPMDPTAAKKVLLGALFNCLSPMLAIGARSSDIPLMGHPIKIKAVLEARKEFAGPSCDDYLADVRGYFAFDDAKSRCDYDTMQDLIETSFIRPDNHAEMSRIARQTYAQIRPVLGIDDSQPIQQTAPYFPGTPPAFNVNSENEDLIKALAFSVSGTRLAVYEGFNFRTPNRGRVLVAPRSVNHGVTSKDRIIQKLRREQGDLLSYGALRIVPDDKYPWATETSLITPLTALLFAESVRLVGDSTLVINDWAYYTIQTSDTSTTNSSSSSATSPSRAAKIMLEYRKSLDRFICTAFSNIARDPTCLQAVKTGKYSPRDFNTFFQKGGSDEQATKIKEIVVNSLGKILARERQARNRRIEERRIKLTTEFDEDSGHVAWLDSLEGKL